MDALDGNAIAGDHYAAFGHEMTTVVGTCTSCGAARFSRYELSDGSRGNDR